MTTAVIAALVLVSLVVDLPLLLWRRARQRDRERARLLAAHERAAALVQRALDAYRRGEGHEVRGEDLCARALVAASGEGEAAARARVVQALQRSEPMPVLQVLLAEAAERQERDLALATGPGQLMENIAEARETVIALVPRGM